MIGLECTLSDKEEEDRIEYTHIIPQWTLIRKEDDDELLGLIVDDNISANEVIIIDHKIKKEKAKEKKTK